MPNLPKNHRLHYPRLMVIAAMTATVLATSACGESTQRDAATADEASPTVAGAPPTCELERSKGTPVWIQDGPTFDSTSQLAAEADTVVVGTLEELAWTGPMSEVASNEMRSMNQAEGVAVPKDPTLGYRMRVSDTLKGEAPSTILMYSPDPATVIPSTQLCAGQTVMVFLNSGYGLSGPAPGYFVLSLDQGVYPVVDGRIDPPKETISTSLDAEINGARPADVKLRS